MVLKSSLSGLMNLFQKALFKLESLLIDCRIKQFCSEFSLIFLIFKACYEDILFKLFRFLSGVSSLCADRLSVDLAWSNTVSSSGCKRWIFYLPKLCATNLLDRFDSFVCRFIWVFSALSGDVSKRGAFYREQAEGFFF